jgi:hypothetical protein
MTVALEDAELRDDRNDSLHARRPGDCFFGGLRESGARTREVPDPALGDDDRTGDVIQVDRRLAVHAGAIARQQQNQPDRDGDASGR